MQLSKETRNYINLLTVVSAVLLIGTMYYFPPKDISRLLYWILLAIIGESVFIGLPGVSGAAVSVAVGVSTAAMIVGGPALSVLVSVMGFALRTEKINNRYVASIFYYPYYKNAFNYSQIAIIEIMTSISYIVLRNLIKPHNVIIHFILVMLLVIIRLIVNSTLAAKLFATISKKPIKEIWVTGFKQVIIPFTFIGSMGIALGLSYTNYGPIAALVYFGPILLMKLCIKQYIKIKEMYQDVNTDK